MIKDQDEIHDEHVRFYQDSEKLLKLYYDEKLKYCLNQIKLRDTPKVEISIQTEVDYEPELKLEHEETIKVQSLQLGKYPFTNY